MLPGSNLKIRFNAPSPGFAFQQRESTTSWPEFLWKNFCLARIKFSLRLLSRFCFPAGFSPGSWRRVFSLAGSRPVEISRRDTWREFFPGRIPPGKQGCFPFTKNFGKFLLGILGISVWEKSVPFVTSPIRLQAPLRRFTKKPDALINSSAIFSNESLFVAFPSNKCLLSACVVMRSLTSACSRRSRFTVVETSPVNERTFQSCSCNILHGKHAPVKKAANKQEFLPTIFI